LCYAFETSAYAVPAQADRPLPWAMAAVAAQQSMRDSHRVRKEPLGESGTPAQGGFLNGVAVLVTGAASGIGLAVAVRCLSEGATVAALDRDGPAVSRTVAGLPVGDRDRAIAVQADVADPDQVRAALATTGDRLGRLTAVVNVAGIGGYTGDIGQTSPAEWARTLAVNLSGTFHVCRAALPLLRASGTDRRASGTDRRASGTGRIVNVSSQYGLVGGAGSPAYSAAKAGVIGLIRAMAVDHAAEGILVNCVCPGPIDTPMLRASASHSELAGREAARTAGRVLLGGPGRPEDVAGVIAFLLGPDAGFLTGAVLTCDGGWTAG
jgi:NAD(P)-dependent dehydrogenase (short-subunit alcohol dehydrogenase family)